jgi:hypothetical protein
MTTILTHRRSMSLAPYSYRPATPPDGAAVDQLHNIIHSRNTSSSSYRNNGSSPESSYTALTTPSKSPVLRQHGPTLLPKIRPQDAIIATTSAGGPKRTHRRMLSTSHITKSFAPYNTSRPSVQRSVTEPLETSTLISPVSSSSTFFGPRASSTFEPPVTATASYSKKHSISHSRSGSASSIDESMLNRYGYPTYRQLPMYCAPASQHQPISIQAPSAYMPCQPPVPSIENHDFAFPSSYPTPVEIGFGSRNCSLTPPPSVDLVPNGCLLSYLSEPTQPINLVRQLTISPGRGLNNYFWWDVRNVRSWDTFSLDTISSIPGLLPLLNFGVDTTVFPQGPSPSNTAVPASELDLAVIASKIYFPKVNAAIQLSQGSTSLSLYPAPSPDRSTGNPHFLANYSHDADRTLDGLPRGRVVGLVKSFDRWNTGMRRESPARKVDYLSALSHLQKCMRDHSCRYGFILTEIELVCVRAGCDDNDQPYFGYLEVSEAIATKNAAAAAQFAAERGTPEPIETPLTVTLALYYLLMLAKSTPLPGQPSSFMDVGGPGALTRQRTWSGIDLPENERGKDNKDKWIPEPQVGEKRDAKRIRGWVWPQDPWHKREGNGSGKRGVRP